MAFAKSVALSDLHLGRRHSLIQKPEDIAPLVGGFEHVLLLGDIVDHWYTHAHEADQIEARIEAICQEAGAKQVTWFRGNHDAENEGLDYMLIDRVLYFHGHAVFNRLHGTGSLDERIEALNNKKYGKHRRGSRKERPVWGMIEKAYERIPQKWANPIVWNAVTKQRIRKLADEMSGGADVRAVVFGHTHCPGRRRVKHLDVFNLGGWMKNTTACGFIREGHKCRFQPIEFKNGKPRWGSALARVSI